MLGIEDEFRLDFDALAKVGFIMPICEVVVDSWISLNPRQSTGHFTVTDSLVSVDDN